MPHSFRQQIFDASRPLIVLIGLASALRAQDPTFAARDTIAAHWESGSHNKLFQFSAAAQDALAVLWNASIAARQERVACIGGYTAGGIEHITRVMEVPPEKADSLAVSAVVSLRRCAPPNWSGTVHTHIARFGGQPYVAFSGADRSVMQLWRHRWRAEGVFCVLYSEWQANCEGSIGMEGEAWYAYHAVTGRH